MFTDLREASAKKPNMFTSALMEYLAKELRNNNVKCRRKISYIDVKMDRPVNNVYSNLIIDCFDGNVYLRGNDVNDKRVLKMRRFNLGDRESDALYCAKGACLQISRYLKKINNIENNMQKEANKIDLRKKLKMVTTASTNTCVNKLLDMRGKVIVAKKQLIDMRHKVTRLDLREKTATMVDLRKKTIVAYQRDFAIAIIDGKIYEGDTHGECVTQCLNEMGIEGIEFYDRIDLRENLGFNFYSQFAAAHSDSDKIYLDKLSLENISADQAIKILKNNYPDRDIYDYDSREKIAIFLDKRNRDNAVVYVNGDIIEGYDHWEIMKQYAKDQGIDIEDFKFESEYENTVEKLFDNSNYAPGNKLNGTFYFEEDFLTNCSESEIEQTIKQKYPNCEVIFHEMDNEGYIEYINQNTGCKSNKISNNKKSIIKRLKITT